MASPPVWPHPVPPDDPPTGQIPGASQPGRGVNAQLKYLKNVVNGQRLAVDRLIKPAYSQYGTSSTVLQNEVFGFGVNCVFKSPEAWEAELCASPAERDPRWTKLLAHRCLHESGTPESERIEIAAAASRCWRMWRPESEGKESWGHGNCQYRLSIWNQKEGTWVHEWIPCSLSKGSRAFTPVVGLLVDMLACWHHIPYGTMRTSEARAAVPRTADRTRRARETSASSGSCSASAAEDGPDDADGQDEGCDFDESSREQHQEPQKTRHFKALILTKYLDTNRRGQQRRLTP